MRISKWIRSLLYFPLYFSLVFKLKFSYQFLSFIISVTSEKRKRHRQTKLRIVYRLDDFWPILYTKRYLYVRLKTSWRFFSSYITSSNFYSGYTVTANPILLMHTTRYRRLSRCCWTDWVAYSRLVYSQKVRAGV